MGEEPLQRIGVIGVGELAEAIVTGLSTGETAPAVLLSPRGAERAAALANRFPNVRVCDANQRVADGADVLLLTLRPDDADALRDLRVPEGVPVISALAGVSIERLRDLLRTDAPIVRAIPLPSVRQRRGVTAVHPGHPVSTALFDRLGGTLVLDDERALSVLSAATGTVTAFLQYVATVADWVARNGVPHEVGERYVRGVFADLGPELGSGGRGLSELLRDHETPGGLNAQLRAEWFDPANSGALEDALDALLRRTGSDRSGL